MSDDQNAPADLSSIGLDLTQMFRPAWTTETSGNTDQLAARFDSGDDRPERRGPGRNKDSRGRDDRGPGARRPERGPGGPRRDQGNSRSNPGNREGKPGREGFRGNRDRGERRHDEPRREPAPQPVLQGWKLSLHPEHSALEAISKQIRSRAKAYPLFELARLVIHLSDRYRITLAPESAETPALFRAKTDGSLWTTRKEAISHLLAKHLEKFYRRTTLSVEPPKGAYAVVAQCGMSGVLLGPPNHHEYQSRLIALHSSRFKNLPFEVYKSRVKMMRDEALLEQWKTEQSTRTVFVPVSGNSETETTEIISPVDAVEESSVETTLEGTTSEPATEAPAESAAEVLTDSSSETEAAPSTESLEEPSAESSSTEEIDAAPEGEEQASPAADGEQLSFEELTEHFLKNHAEHEIESVHGELTVPGPVALRGSDPLLRELLLNTLRELDRFPLPLAQVIGKELTSSGLQIFKAQKKIIHVSVARPRYLDCATTPTSEGTRSILTYLEAHPKQLRDKQWAGLLALRTEPAGEEPEAVQRREQALSSDLLWLLQQGHVIDFAMGNLQAALRPVQPQQKAPSAATQQPASTTAETSVVSETEELTSVEAEAVIVEAEEVAETVEALEAVEVIETAPAVEAPVQESTLIEEPSPLPDPLPTEPANPTQ